MRHAVVVSSVLVAVAIAASVSLLPSHSMAQSAYPAGPMNPADTKPPKPENSQADVMKDKLGKWFGTRSKGAEEGQQLEKVEVRKGAGAPGQFDIVTTHRVKKTQAELDAEAIETAPEEDLVNTALEKIQQAETKKAPARPPLLAQPTLKNPDVSEPVVNAENPPANLPALDNPGNPYGLTATQKKLNDTAQLIEQNRLLEAERQLNSLKQWLTESTEAHIGLYKALNKLPSAQVQSELEKQVALEFAQMRDKAVYQLARINHLRNNNLEAIKLYVEVVKSQPSSQLGLQAYQNLQEMGFTQKLQLVAQ